MQRFAPPGIAMHVVATEGAADPSAETNLARVLGLADPAAIAEAAKELLPLEVSSIGYACTSASYVRGVEGAAEISREVADVTGLPATTTSTAMVNALRSLEIRSVAVLSPHVDELNERLEAFLRDSGFEVVRMLGLSEVRDIDAVPAEEVQRLVVEDLDCPDADGVFISCTSMRTSPIIERTEELIGKPVVTANQATVWEALRLAGLFAKRPGLGKLYRRA